MSIEIDFDCFWEWAVKRFGDDNVIRNGDEVRINSPFVPEYDPDDGHHLWCNPDKNAYHCFKSNEHGNLRQLVSQMEGCPFYDVDDILGINEIRNLEKKLAEFFAEKKESKKKVLPVEGLELPPEAFKIVNLPADNRFRKKAEEYLAKRKIPVDDFFVCVGGKYANRILIPYYDKDGKLFYYNTRDISNKSSLRYLGPPKEVGIGKSDVIWIKSWPAVGSKVYLCEGEFDAASLWEAEFYGAACGGKTLSDKQGLLLQDYGVVICFDLDKYGQEALHKIGRFIRSNSGYARKIGYVKPAQGFKDWNDMLVKLGKGALHLYIQKYEKPITANDIDIMRLQSS